MRDALNSALDEEMSRDEKVSQQGSHIALMCPCLQELNREGVVDLLLFGMIGLICMHFRNCFYMRHLTGCPLLVLIGRCL